MSVAVHNEIARDPDRSIAGAAGARRAEERRERLVDAARTLFAEHGFHAAGMAQIASLSGVRIGQIYRDFASKEEIVGAIVEADLHAFLDESALRTAIAGGDLAAVRGWIGDLVLRKAHPSQAPLLPEILAEASRNERIAAIVGCVDARVRDSLLRALAAFVPSPVCAERLAGSADLIMTVMMGLCSRQLARLQADSAMLTARIQHIVDREIEGLTA